MYGGCLLCPLYPLLVEFRRKICLFERVPRRLFIQSSSSHVRLLLEAPCWLNAVKKKKLHFSKERRSAFLLFDAKAIRGDALSIKCDRILCFSKDRQGAYFCPTYIEGGVLSRIYGLDSICRFYYIYICCQFVLHLSALLHLWGLLHLRSIITFVASRWKSTLLCFLVFVFGLTFLKNHAVISERFWTSLKRWDGQLCSKESKRTTCSTDWYF